MDIYQHYRKEEHAFIDKVLEWKAAVEFQYSPKLTDFLDPREQEIINLIIGDHSDVQVKAFGGSTTSERKRVLIYPSYLSPTEEDFQLSLYQVDYPSKFVKIEHPQVLGSLMSIGLKRSKYGDILLDDDNIIQIVVSKEVDGFIEVNLQSIGKASVTLKKLKLEDILVQKEEWIEQSVSFSSLRLDVVISSTFQLSRQKAQAIIQNGQVKVNWRIVENASFECKEGDIISVRGHGRLKLLNNEGKSKKDKLRYTVGKQK
ncbi:YlmH family RNA-binding protein [Litchfieldia salsa]|uniref:RNA-binding protein YlmH, contains S4-like domain n=1 Tax=Litchfieldia salsa TaxID=930152 RepID=A0A1H0RD89_9BACI|nr:RNA-binding protein [Litchfieldia salsa]SDP27401.1 RNA-binding protein YlmH, contains S4-like domain [Litchfieldia salsa]